MIYEVNSSKGCGLLKNAVDLDYKGNKAQSNGENEANLQQLLFIQRFKILFNGSLQPEPESDDEYPYEEIQMGELPKRKKRYIDDSTCFHRATSFDSSFQSDMARYIVTKTHYHVTNKT